MMLEVLDDAFAVEAGNDAQAGDLQSVRSFGQGDDIWEAQGRPSLRASVRLTASFFAAVLPAAALFTAIAWWNLSFPYRLLDEALYESWPPFIQWTLILWMGVVDMYWNLFAPVCIWAAFRNSGASKGLPAWANFMLACLPFPYLISLQLLGLYDPTSVIKHLPVYVLWAGIAFANAVTSGDTAETRWMRKAISTGATFGPIFLPVLTGLLIRFFVFPLYVSDDSDVFYKTIVVNMVVPITFHVSHRVACWGCLELMDQGYHPGNVSCLLFLALICESIHRRTLLCATNSLGMTLLSSLLLGLMDAFNQLSIDLRDGLAYTCRHCRRPPPDLFEDRGRRRLRADCLILHLMCEHLAIMSMSSLMIMMQVNSGKSGIAIITTLVNLVVQVATRFVFDIATCHAEATYGTIMRRLFQVERWHGIAVYEVWRRRKWELILKSIHMTLLVASAFMFYLKGFFLTALTKDS